LTGWQAMRKRLIRHASNRDAGPRRSAAVRREPEQPELGEIGARAGHGTEGRLRLWTLPALRERRPEPEIPDIRVGALLQRRPVELRGFGILAVAVISVAHAERRGGIASERGPATLRQRRPVLGGPAGGDGHPFLGVSRVLADEPAGEATVPH